MYNSPTIADLLMATLRSGRSVRKFNKILYERRLKRFKKESIRVVLSRLSLRGYVDNSTAGWSLTKKGEIKAEKKMLFAYIPSPFGNNSSSHTIIAFDIPEKDRAVRRWLRNQIKIFGYKMLQQSLWIGPGPLPTLFLKRLEELKIRKNVKTFRIASKNN